MGSTELAIVLPIPVKKELNSSAMSVGSSRVVLFAVILLILLCVCLPVVSSLRVSHVFLGLFACELRVLV